MRVFNPIKSKEESVLSFLAGNQQVLNPQEPPLPNDCQHALMSVRPSESRELVPGFERHSDPGRPTELDQPFQPIVSPFPGYADVIKLT
jgi:hypothetical protein